MRHSVEQITLHSGAKGLLIDVPDASVMNIKVEFRAGMRYAKKPELFEIAHVVEHLSFGANSKYRDEQAYEADFTKNGAYHNAWTSDLDVCYETECADFEWERIMDLKRLSITTPRFNEEELKSEKGNVRAELTGYLNEYPRLIWPRLQVNIGEKVPSLRKRLATIPNIELKDIREHYRRTHTAKNMRFIITGRVRKRRRSIIRMLNDWELKEGERFEAPLDELKSSDATLIRRKDATNITFGFCFVTPHRLKPLEVCAMDCLNHILNGTMSSRIFGEARKRGLVYGMGSTISNSVRNCSWDFDGEVNIENAAPLFDLIRSELANTLNGKISDSDLEAAKSYALGRYQMSAQTVAQISDYYSESFFLSDEVEKYNRVPDIINSVTKPLIVELAREFVDSNIHGLAAVSSCEKSLITDLYTKLHL